MLPADEHGPFPGGASETSEATQQVLDTEVRRLIDAVHIEVGDLLATHRDQLDSLTAALLKTETLDERDAYAAARVQPHRPGGPRELVSSLSIAKLTRADAVSSRGRQ